MSAKEKILQAYETILISQGEKAATLDAVARAAGVSKGGLLYHFPSKEAMADGLISRFEELAAKDLELMHLAPEGASTYYINTSYYEDTPFDRALIAVSRLAQESNAAASTALKNIQDASTRLLQEELGNAELARVVVLLSDGMYYNAAFMGSGRQEDIEKDRLTLLKTVETLRAQ